jgi:hypothetical protein
MTEPSAPRPVPGPGRPVPGPVAPPSPDETRREPGGNDRFAGLADRPVAEHTEVFEAEHDRLHSELGTIDRV